MYFITTKRMLEVCFFQHTPTFIIEPEFTHRKTKHILNFTIFKHKRSESNEQINTFILSTPTI